MARVTADPEGGLLQHLLNENTVSDALRLHLAGGRPTLRGTEVASRGCNAIGLRQIELELLFIALAPSARRGGSPIGAGH